MNDLPKGRLATPLRSYNTPLRSCLRPLPRAPATSEVEGGGTQKAVSKASQERPNLCPRPKTGAAPSLPRISEPPTADSCSGVFLPAFGVPRVLAGWLPWCTRPRNSHTLRIPAALVRCRPPIEHAWLPGCPAARLPGSLARWVPGSLAAWLHGWHAFTALRSPRPWESSGEVCRPANSSQLPS